MMHVPPHSGPSRGPSRASIRPTFRRALAFAAALLLAGEASAFSYYAEIWTSQHTPFLRDKHAVVDVDVDFDPFDISLYHDVTSPGLGSGIVDGDTTLTFDFSLPKGTVEGAWLYVAAGDDYRPWSDGSEVAWLKVKNASSNHDYSSEVNALSFLGGDVLDLLGNGTNGLLAELGAKRGDFKLYAAALKVKYRDVPAVPEPTAVGLFAIGVLTVATALRRRAA